MIAASWPAPIAPTIASPSRRTVNAAAPASPTTANGTMRPRMSASAPEAATRSRHTSATPTTARNGHSDWISSVQLSSSGVTVTAATPIMAGTNPTRRRASEYQQQANRQAHSTGTIVNLSRLTPTTATNGARMIGNPHGYNGGLNAGPSLLSTVNWFGVSTRL